MSVDSVTVLWVKVATIVSLVQGISAVNILKVVC